jgi:heat shock protein HslJ
MKRLVSAVSIACLGFALGGCPAPDTLQMLPAAPDGGKPALHAFGNNPSWALRIDETEWSFTETAVGRDASGKTPNAERLPQGGWRYENDEIRVDLQSRRCTDTQTGLRYFDTVSVTYDGRVFAGCGGIELPPENLDGTAWRGNKQIPEAGGMIPRQFDGELQFKDGKLTGNTGCNRISADYAVSENTLSVGPIAMTKMACEGQAGRFEQRLLQVLEQPSQITFQRTGEMVLSPSIDVFISFDQVRD